MNDNPVLAIVLSSLLAMGVLAGVLALGRRGSASPSRNRNSSRIAGAAILAAAIVVAGLAISRYA